VKVPFEYPFSPPSKEYSKEYFEQLFTLIQRHFAVIADEINGQIGFGNGTDRENVRGTWVTYTSNGVANTEDTVAHGLTVIPIGYLVVRQDKAGVVYSGTTAWTTTNLYLKCSVATQVTLLYVLTAPEASS
jgi:hypothetical protein